VVKLKKVFKMKNIKEINKKKDSFTLIEVLIALIVLSVGILSVIALSSKSYAAISLQKNKLIANNLAREGIELVTNVRNENWLYRGNSSCNSETTPPEITKCDGTSNCENDVLILSYGQKCEDNHHCDWRCFNSKNSESGGAEYRLDKCIKDIDYLENVAFHEPCPEENIRSCRDNGAGLYLNNGFYQNKSCEGCKLSPFQRLIVVDREGSESRIIVETKVCWQERGGRWQEVILEKHLYNWIQNTYKDL